MTAVFSRPDPAEYPPYYATYVDKVPSGDLLGHLEKQIGAIEDTFRRMPAGRATFAYAPGKWTVNEVLGHLADTERVFGYRLLTFARNDPASLPSFDENAWVPAGRFNGRSLAEMVAELVATRRATLALLGGLPADAPAATGTASGKPISVRALAHLLYGHVAHHLGIIHERYA